MAELAASRQVPVCPVCKSGYPTFAPGIRCANCDYEGDEFELIGYDNRRPGSRRMAHGPKYYLVTGNDGHPIREIVQGVSEADAKGSFRKYFKDKGVKLILGSEKAELLSHDEPDEYLVRTGTGPNALVIRRR